MSEELQTKLTALNTLNDEALELMHQIQTAYTGDLDNLMSKIYSEVITGEEPPIEILEKYFLELSTTLYFVGIRVEELGLREGMSKMSYKEIYNNYFMNPVTDKAKPTVGDITAFAENSSLDSQMLMEISSRIYKTAKNKLDAANTVVSTLSKCISRRMNELNLSAMQPAVGEVTSNRRVLNETV